MQTKCDCQPFCSANSSASRAWRAAACRSPALVSAARWTWQSSTAWSNRSVRAIAVARTRSDSAAAWSPDSSPATPRLSSAATSASGPPRPAVVRAVTRKASLRPRPGRASNRPRRSSAVACRTRTRSWRNASGSAPRPASTRSAAPTSPASIATSAATTPTWGRARTWPGTESNTALSRPLPSRSTSGSTECSTISAVNWSSAARRACRSATAGWACRWCQWAAVWCKDASSAGRERRSSAERWARSTGWQRYHSGAVSSLLTNELVRSSASNTRPGLGCRVSAPASSALTASHTLVATRTSRTRWGCRASTSSPR